MYFHLFVHYSTITALCPLQVKGQPVKEPDERCPNSFVDAARGKRGTANGIQAFYSNDLSSFLFLYRNFLVRSWFVLVSSEK